MTNETRDKGRSVQALAVEQVLRDTPTSVVCQNYKDFAARMASALLGERVSGKDEEARPPFPVGLVLVATGTWPGATPVGPVAILRTTPGGRGLSEGADARVTAWEIDGDRQSQPARPATAEEVALLLAALPEEAAAAILRQDYERALRIVGNKSND